MAEHGHPLKAIRIRIPRGDADAAAAWVRLERDQDDYLISPLLGSAWLCERCWVMRRAATCDPAALAPGASCSADLLAAFEAGVAASGRPSPPPQRASVAALLRARAHSARAPAPAPAVPLLARVAPWGGVVAEPVLPRPDCAPCLARTGSAVVPALFNASSRAAGIVVERVDVPPRQAEPAYPHVVTTRLANALLVPGRPAWRGASGKGDSRSQAHVSALGESIERYAAEMVPQAGLRRARRAELDRAIDPCRLTGTDATQARDAGLDPDRETAWVAAQTVAAPSQRWWLPASSVYLAAAGSVGPALTLPSSNGLAAAPRLDDAIRRAYAEVIERHAFFLVWYGLAAAKTADARPMLERAVHEQFHACGLVLQACVLGCVDGIHVAAASCWPDTVAPQRPSFALGLGNGASAVQAVRSAAREAAQVYRGLCWALDSATMRARLQALRQTPRAACEPYDHALLHAGGSAERVPAPFGCGAPRGSPSRALTGLLDRALFVDLTPPDVAQGCGVRVARVVVPDAIPLHVGVRMLPRRVLGLRDADERAGADWLHPLS